MRDEAVAALADAAPGYLGTSHRREGVRSVVRSVREGLAELFALPDGYEVLLGNGGTTAFWDAAAFGLDRAAQPAPRVRRVLVEVRGRHPRRRRTSTTRCDRVAPGHAPRGARDRRRRRLRATRTTRRRPASWCRAPEGDVTGSCSSTRRRPPAACASTRPSSTSTTSRPEGFAADGGLWLALCSPAAIERIEASARPAGGCRRRSTSRSRSRTRGSTRRTTRPALATLFLLADQIEWMLGNGGLEWAATRCDRSAEILYGWAEASAYATPFVAKPSERSHVTATIDFDDVDAAAIAAALRANGIVDTEPYRKLGRNQLRIAMFPAIEPDDVAALTRCIDFVDRAPCRNGSKPVEATRQPPPRAPWRCPTGSSPSSSATARRASSSLPVLTHAGRRRRVPLTIYSQDDPTFPAGLGARDDTALDVSFALDLDTVPTLLRVEDGTEVARVGWSREQWEELTGRADLGRGLSRLPAGLRLAHARPRHRRRSACRVAG